MSRTVRNAKLDTRSARTKLHARRDPYWVVISKGCALGYRKGAKGGTWIARFRDDAGKQHFKSLGAADDAIDADTGDLVLAYQAAQKKAEDWFKLAERGFEEEDEKPGKPGVYLVADAMKDYMAKYQREGGKAPKRTQTIIDALIVPPLGSVAVAKLTKKRIEKWQDGLVSTAARLRTKPGKAQKYRKLDTSEDGIRRRKSTANRILTVLKAALNHAHRQGKAASDDAWKSVKPYREVDVARVRYLNDEEAKRLVNASTSEFRPLVQAAMLTGCRYGELVALVVADYSADAGTIHIRKSKGGKARHIFLTEEGKTFFTAMTIGKTGNQPIFTKPSETLARIARLTDLDYATLTGLTVECYVRNGEESSLLISQRTVPLSRIAAKAIGRLCDGKDADRTLVPEPHFVSWKTSHQQRPFDVAIVKAKLDTLTFHELRHTYASRLVMKGVPLMVVAAQLGHSDTRMVEKHYGHLAASYVADTVRAAFGTMGILEDTNVTPFAPT
jgi:integrase